MTTTKRSRNRPSGYPAPELPLPETWPRLVLIRDVLAAAERASGLGAGRITGTSRLPDVVDWRFAAIEVAVQTTGASLQAIGRVFSRDHTTVLHARRRVARDVALGDADTIRCLDAVCAALIDRMMRVQPPVVVVQVPARPKADVVAADEGAPPQVGPVTTTSAAGIVRDGAMDAAWWAANDARFRAAFVRAMAEEVPA